MFTTLIEPARLASELGNPNWVIFDCRHDLADLAAGRAAYEQGHIPGARFANVQEDLAGPKSGRNGRHPLPDVEALADFLRTASVSDDTQVIAYDASGGMYAARLWWLLRWLGHLQVAVLDGGLPGWSAAGLALTTDTSTVAPGNFFARPGAMPHLEVHELERLLDQHGVQIIDARAGPRFCGEVEPLDAVAGHIPGALNRFYQDNLGADGRFKPGPVLRTEFLPLLGERDASEILHQCGSGVSACHNLLAMELAGLHGSQLYPGSWSEWCANPARAVARGPA